MQGESELWWSWCLEAEKQDNVNTETETISKLKEIPGSQWNGRGKKPTVLHGRTSKGRRRHRATVDLDLEKTAFKFEIKINTQKHEPPHVPKKKLSISTRDVKKERNTIKKQACRFAERHTEKATNTTLTEYTRPDFPSNHGRVSLYYNPYTFAFVLGLH